MEEVFGILVLVVVIPLWLILHYATALKKSKSLTKGDEQMLEELWNLSQKMEERIETLEVILDRENKGWSK